MKAVIQGIGIVSALGAGKNASAVALKKRKPCLGRNNPFGILAGVVKTDFDELKSKSAEMLIWALREALSDSEPFNTEDRVGLFLGTTTAGIDVVEKYIKQYVAGKHQDLDAAQYLSHYLLGNCALISSKTIRKAVPVMSVSTACSSSANAVSLGLDALLNNDLDVAIVAGSETLCNLTVHGFSSLLLLSDKQSRPFSKNSLGINLGEGAAALVLRRSGNGYANILGVGHSSDAYHMTAPRPDGREALHAMHKACAMAGITPDKIDYVNAHGTGTDFNDKAEVAAFRQLFKDTRWPVIASTKSLTGHCLGASGLLELAFTAMGVHDKKFPMGLPVDDAIDKSIREPFEGEPLGIAMSNSFGFGGNNTSIIISSTDYEKNR